MVEIRVDDASAEAAAAAEDATAPLTRQGAELEFEPPLQSLASQAPPRSGDDNASMPPTDSVSRANAVALVDSDPASGVTAVPDSNTTATAPEDPFSVTSEQEVKPAGADEPARADAAAKDDTSPQQLLELSDCPRAAGAANGLAATSVDAESAEEHDDLGAEFPGTVPALSAAAAETTMHDTTEPPAEASDDPPDPNANDVSSGGSAAAVESATEGHTKAAEPGTMLISEKVSPDEADDGAVQGELAPDADWASEQNVAGPVAVEAANPRSTAE